MSQTETTPDRTDANLARTILLGVGTGLLCWTLLLWRFSTEPAIGLWLLAMAFLFFRFSSTVYVVVGVVIMWPMFSRQRYFNQFASDVPEITTIFFALLLTGFIWFAFRFVDSLSVVSIIRNRLPEQSRHRHPTPHDASAGTGAVGLLLIPVSVVLAIMALVLFPENEQSRSLYRLTPPGLRAITFVWVIGISWVVVKSSFGLIGWFRLNPDEAGLYIRNVFGQEVHRELGKIERVRSKVKRELD